MIAKIELRQDFEPAHIDSDV